MKNGEAIKVIVLGASHRFTDEKIKELINADSVERVENSSHYAASTIYEYICAMSKYFNFADDYFEGFIVSGESASTAFIELNGNVLNIFEASLVLSEDTFAELSQKAQVTCTLREIMDLVDELDGKISYLFSIEGEACEISIDGVLRSELGKVYTDVGYDNEIEDYWSKTW